VLLHYNKLIAKLESPAISELPRALQTGYAWADETLQLRRFSSQNRTAH